MFFSKVGKLFIAVSAFKAKVLPQFLCRWLRLYLRSVLSNSNSTLQKIMSVLLIIQGWKFSVLSGLSVWVLFSFLRSKSMVQYKVRAGLTSPQAFSFLQLMEPDGLLSCSQFRVAFICPLPKPD